MARIAIVNHKSGLVLGDNDDSVFADGEDEVMAWCARHVAESDAAEDRTFDLYKLPLWDEMTEAQQFTLPQSVDALKANDAVLVRSVTVPMDRSYSNPYG